MNRLAGPALLDRGGEFMTEDSSDASNEHIAHRVGLLAAASPTDEERRFAEEHAAACLPCREALEEAVRLTELLRRALAPSPDL
jgi:hypothetical protein